MSSSIPLVLDEWGPRTVNQGWMSACLHVWPFTGAHWRHTCRVCCTQAMQSIQKRDFFFFFKHKYWHTFCTLLSNSTCCEVKVSGIYVLRWRVYNKYRSRSVTNSKHTVYTHTQTHISAFIYLQDHLRWRLILIKIWNFPVARGAKVSVTTSLHHLIQHYTAPHLPHMLLTLDPIFLIYLRLLSTHDMMI